MSPESPPDGPASVRAPDRAPAPGPDAPRGPPASPVDIAIRFGLLGGAFASAFVVLPALFSARGGGALTDYTGLMVAMLAIWMGARALGRAHPGLPYTRRLVLGSVIAVLASTVLGLALWLLYAVLRPQLLAERYAGMEERVRASGRTPEAIATELERLAATKPQHLDPVFQAVGSAGTLFFFGMVLALYAAWRWRVTQRLRSM